MLKIEPVARCRAVAFHAQPPQPFRLTAPRPGPSLTSLAMDDDPLPGAQLHAAGCAKVYSEKVSGARTDRVELGKLLKRLDEGDGLIVTRLDRLPVPPGTC